MKKIYVPIIAVVFFALLASGLVSCSKEGFLSQTVTNNLNEEVVFGDSSNTVAFLTGIYTSIGVSYAPNRFGNGALDVAADESEISSTNLSTASQFSTGTVNAGIVTNDVYNTCYTSIRSVNVLLKNLSSRSGIGNPRQAQMRAEARFLRAWYYAILLKHYGGVAIIGDTVYNYTDRIPVARSTYDQTVEYVVSELQAASEVLPPVQFGLEYGRATKGACLALISRVRLYAASPQFNDPSPNGTERTSLTLALETPEDPVKNPGGILKELVAYKTYSNDRWTVAKDAALAVINSGIYSLYYDTTKIETQSNISNKLRPGLGFQSQFRERMTSEHILALMKRADQADGNEYETQFLPPSHGGNRSGGFPYQQIVDAFPMRNGKAITDPTSGYNDQAPFANRDPRLDFTVVHDRSRVAKRSFPQPFPFLEVIDMSRNSGTGDEAKKGTPTGYYRYKLLDSLVPGTFGIVNNSRRCPPLIRYAEILLNYVEAENELNGPGTAITGEVYKYLIAIRKRAGILPGTDGLYGLNGDMTKDEARLAIQNERRIELAFEEHRFWDVRRWKKASEAFTKQMTGIEVIRSGGNTSYTRFNVRKHDFRPAMYLWPFPQAETGKSPELLQNPGYL
ncbi:MAG: RagB/SusD family nutrient uptake outer membrane protein [Sphingobacteriaceae bacterium]|nr:MAG: RagB/SusD family nutrient uptake outer membrane protein [Sphingobacteriaceae bacterium]